MLIREVDSVIIKTSEGLESERGSIFDYFKTGEILSIDRDIKIKYDHWRKIKLKIEQGYPKALFFPGVGITEIVQHSGRRPNAWIVAHAIPGYRPSS